MTSSDSSKRVPVVRPWQHMYGVRLRATTERAHESPLDKGETQERVLSLIERILPDELLLECFKRLPLQSLAYCRCVCREWHGIANDRNLWKIMCRTLYSEEPLDTLEEEHVNSTYPPIQTSWKNMFHVRPRLRRDGIYVSRNTYIRTGIPEWKVKNPVHLVCYYRYLRFLPQSNQMVYRTSPLVLKHVYRSLMDVEETESSQPSPYAQSDKSKVFSGKFKLINNTVYTAFMYPNSFSTEVRSKLSLRSTCPGAFNRLDIESIVSYDRERGVSMNMMHPLDEEDDILGEKREHKKGIEAYIFVPFSEVSTHMINKPVEQMDFLITG